MTMSGLTAETRFATSGSRGERDRKKKEEVDIVWKKNRDRERVQEALIQRASVCSPRLSITLDSQGPFRMAVNHGPALPARRLEAQDKPTAELHPVCASSTAHSSATMGHSSHFTLQEDPVCQSISNHAMCECEGSLRVTWVAGKLVYRQTDRGTARQSDQENEGTSWPRIRWVFLLFFDHFIPLFDTQQ